MVAVILLVVVFLILGFVFALGKGGFLIAGYNTASSEDKAKYDEKRLNRCFAVFCFGIAIVIGITGYVDTEKFAVGAGLPLIFLLLGFILVVTNTYCKKSSKLRLYIMTPLHFLVKRRHNFSSRYY